MLLEQDIENEILSEEFVEAEETEQISDEVFVGEFVGNTLCGAREYIKRFFETQQMYCGGTIPERFLLTEENISMVANTYIEDGIKLAYQIIERDGRYSNDAIESLVPEDVKLVLSIMSKASKVRVPQNFLPGLILLYLEYCEGMTCSLT